MTVRCQVFVGFHQLFHEVGKLGMAHIISLFLGSLHMSEVSGGMQTYPTYKTRLKANDFCLFDLRTF
jgi:hypothetical protein